MIRRLCLAAALAVTLVASSFSAAHAATVSPSKWAPKFCTTLRTWQSAIGDKAEEVQSSLSGASNLQTARDKLVKFLGEMESSTQRAVDSLKRAGTPSSPNGGKIAALFVSAMKTAKDEFADAKDHAAQLSTTDPQAFSRDGVQIGTDLKVAGSQITNSFGDVGKLDKGDKLSSAIEKASACKFLTGGSSS